MRANLSRRWAWATVLVFTVSFAQILSIEAQGLRPQYYNPNDERFKFLALKKAELYLQETRSNYERAKELYQKGLTSEEEYEKAKLTYQHAEVAYQQAMLNVIFDKPHITIEKAVKYQTPEGKKRVKLTLLNTAGGSFDLEKLKTLGEQSYAEKLRPDELTNIYVSIKNEFTIIGQPYEVKIPILKFGERKTIDFLLLQDVDEVVVSINYADKVDEKQIYLQKDASMNIVAVNSIQFSQQADLGGKATFDLILERYTSENTAFKLEVLNLPRQITYDFIDPETGARLSQVKFPEGVTTKTLSLVLYLPDRTSEEIVMDEPIDFYALVLDREAEAKLREMGEGQLSPEQVGSIKSGKAKLELIPRGVGRIEVRAVNLYHEIKPGERVSMDVTVRNNGTRRLDNIRISTDNPLNWQSTVVPDLIQFLPPEKEHTVNITFIPALDLGVGDYEAKIKTECMAENRRVESEDKVVRIHVSARTNILGSAILIVFLIGLVLAIVIFGIRLSRR